MRRNAIDLRHLRYFVAVAEELHFGRAARRLGIAQPPLSQQIQRLEGNLGYPLLTRRPRVALTPAGEALLGVARVTITRVAEEMSYVQRVAQGRAGLLRVSLASSTLLTTLPAILRAFREDYPDVELRLQELSTVAQIDALLSGNCDVGVLREPAKVDDLVYETIAREPFVAILPVKHPLALRGRIPVKALRSEPFVHFPRRIAPTLYDQVLTLCGNAGCTPTVSQEALEWFTIVGLVESGAGIAIVPASFQGLMWHGVAYRPLVPSSVRTTTCIGRRKDSVLPAAHNFFAIARSLAVQFDDRGRARRLAARDGRQR